MVILIYGREVCPSHQLVLLISLQLIDDEYQELLRQRLVELNVETTRELESILEEQVSKRHIPTPEEIAEELRKQEEYRVQSIKLTAQSLILSKYSLERQSSANLGLYGEEYLVEMKAYISNIIKISNEAELSVL